MDKFKIGKLEHLVTWKTPATTRDSYGQVNPDDVYTTLDTRTVAIQPINSTEVMAGQKPEGVTLSKVTQRYLAGLQMKDRMIFGSRTFEITGIINKDERNEWQEITVAELRS